ncbi:MAG: DUF899 family protein [Pseudomonadota bacterium]
MSEPRYPNETAEYRNARDELLELEKELVRTTRAVAEKRRELPLGGRLKEDYQFHWANDERVGEPVRLSGLFGDKPTLMLYNFMYGPGWDKPCLSCTSLMDGFDRTAYQVTQDAAFCGIAKAPAEKINDWANTRDWKDIDLVSGFGTNYQADYQCQADSDDIQWPILHVFRKHEGEIYHFWGTELKGNHVDTVWSYWNLMDLTPEGRPDRLTPPQKFHSEFLQKNYLE